MTVRLKMWLILGLTLIILIGLLYFSASRIVLQGITNLQTLASSGQTKEVISGLIAAEGKSVLRTLLLAMIGVGLFILALALLLTERLILGRLARLSSEVSRINKASESVRVESAGADEIGRLASHINTMLDDLQHSNQNNLELEQRYRILIEQAEEGFALIDAESLDFIDANEAFWRLVGRVPQEGRRLSLVDIFEMEDREADFQEYLEKRVFAKEVQIHHPNGAMSDLEIIGNRGEIAGRAIIFLIARDISARKQMEKDLNQRERYLALLVEIQRSLLAMEAGNFPQDFLGLLGRSIGASRVYVAQGHSGPGKEMRYSCTAEWLDAGVASRLELPIWRDLALEEVFPDWLKAFTEAGIVNSAVTGLGVNADNRAALEDVKAFLVLPLMVKGELYGFLGFEDQRSGSIWHEPEVSLLKAVGSTLSLALERWLAEEASRHQASELEAVIHALPDIYLLIDSEGKILDYHLVGPTKPGISLTFAIGKPLIQVLPEVIVRRIVDGIRRVHETGQPTSLEYYLMEGDERIYYEARLSPLAGDQTIAIIRDITNRKRTEQALRLSESKYRQVVDSVHEVIFQTDLNGHLIFLNQAWSGITGYSIEESLGAALDSYIQEDDRPDCQEMINTLRSGARDGFQGEIRCLTTGGDVRWLAVVAHLTRNEEGQAIGIAGTLTDVTQGRQAEYERRRGEESIRGLYAIISSQEMSFSAKIQALLVMGCEHFSLEMGILSHLVGDMFYAESAYTPDDQITPGSTIDLCNTYCTDTLKAGKPVGIEHASASEHPPRPGVNNRMIEAYLGTPVVVSGLSYGTLSFASVRPHWDKFTDTDKEFLRLMAQWAGVEIERQQYIEQLEISAHEIEVKNQALSEARDQALEAARLKSEFLATMSHEIRTPMNAVIGMAELLEGTNLSAEQRSYAIMVTDSARVLLTLINDILDFSKIEAGKMALEKIEFDILAVVERVADLMAPKAAEKHLELLTSVSPDIPRRVIGDPTRLQQVLLNLVGNATKFTRVGEVVVQVSLVNLTPASVGLHFDISDTGIGLSETARNRLFQPFTQADGSTNRKYGGTGLGLAISKRLVELMEGEIGVDSFEGQGSTFWFTARFEPAFISEEEVLPFENLQPDERALVVVTNASQRMILKNYLAWEGFRVDGASDAREALTMLQVALEAGRPFKVLVVDQRLGDGDCINLAGKIWEMYGSQSIRLVVLVEFDQRQAGEEAVRTGFDAYVLKPVKKLDFVAAVRQVMAGEDRRSLESARPAQLVPERKPVYPAAQQKFQGLVLLAEDNPGNQKLATFQLKKLGFEVTAVSDGRQAVEAVIEDQVRYTLVMMDCQMPDMDGFEATRLIRKAELFTGNHIPIIAMTANALEGDREFCLAAGMDDYIGKPVALDNLRMVLANWVIDHEKAEQVAQPEPTKLDVQHDPLNRVILNGIQELQVEGEPDFLTELVDMYLQDSLLMVKSIHRAIAEKDSELLAQSAHRLKGNSSNLGAVWLAGYCGELEEKARSGSVEGAADLVNRFDEEYQTVRKALTRLRKDTKNLDLP